MSATVLIGCEDGDIPCDRCSGTGNLIKDWERYISAKTTEEIEDCESDCPDCSGYGRFKVENPPPSTHVVVRHKKRGTSYEVLGVGKIQSSEWRDLNEEDVAAFGSIGSSVDMREVTVYRSLDDGTIWVRPREEFEDGRFSTI